MIQNIGEELKEPWERNLYCYK